MMKILRQSITTQKRDGQLMSNDLIVRIKEIFNPKLKCSRVGHKSLEEITEGYSKPGIGRRYVAMRAQRVRYYCTRCGFEFSNKIEETGGGYHSYSWPKHMADEFNKTGFVREYI